MSRTTVDDAIKIVAMLTAAFPSWQATRETVNVYAEILAPLPAEAVKEAVMDIIREDRRYAPSVGSIFQRAVKIAMERAGLEVLTAEEAYKQVSFNFYGSPSAHPLIAAACKTVGWDRMCHDENVSATFAHFARVFNVLQKKEIERVIGAIVAGGELDWLDRPALDVEKNGQGE